MAGSLPGSNSTSTTGPITWTILPSLIRWLPSGLGAGAERFRPADDVEQFLRNPLLARLVVADRELPDQLLGVLGGGFHGRHPRPVLPRRGFQQRVVELGLDVPRQERVEDGRRIGLVQVIDARALAGRGPLG